MNQKYLSQKYRIIIHYIGIVLTGLSLVMLTPLTAMIFYRDEIHQAASFIIPGILVMLAGLLMKRVKTGDFVLRYQEAGIIVVISWILVILASAVPFMAEGYLNFSQSVFETTSAWTTTGLSMVDVSSMSHTFLLWRSIMQLFGGAGIAVIMLAAVIGPKGAGLYTAEGRTDRLRPNVINSVHIIVYIYLGMIAAGIIFYCIAGMPIFDAVNHSIAALSTGGFSTKTDSIGAYGSLTIEFITIILMILGTVNFAVKVLAAE